jgi:gas vesicle protein
MMTTTRRISASVLAALAAITLGACSSSPSSPSSSSSARACAQLDGLVSSMQNLSKATISENGLASLTDTLQQVQTQLDELQNSVSSQVKPQVATVKAQVQQLQDAVAAVRTAPTEQNLAAARTALQTLQSTIIALPAAVQAKC